MYYDNEREAENKAIELRNKMSDPDKWQIDVWYNLGWCFCIYKGPLTVFEATNEGKYHALLADNPNSRGYGSTTWTSDFTSTDPNEVVREQIERAVRHITCRQEVLKVVDYHIKGAKP